MLKNSVTVYTTQTKAGWGTYKIIDISTSSLTSMLSVKAGSSFTYPSHALRNESWPITSDEGKVILDGKEQTVKQGNCIFIKSGVKHSLQVKSDMQLIEVQTGKEISKDDKEVFFDCTFIVTFQYLFCWGINGILKYKVGK